MLKTEMSSDVSGPLYSERIFLPFRVWEVEVNGVIPDWTAVKTGRCNTLKTDVKLNDIYENSLLPFREHTFVHYKDESFNAV